MGKNKKKKFVGWKSDGRVVEVEIDPSLDEPINNGRAKRIERYFNSLRYGYEGREGWLPKSTVSQISALGGSHDQQLPKVQQGARLHVSVDFGNNAIECDEIDLALIVPPVPQKGNQSVCFELRSNGRSQLKVNLLIS